MALDGWCILRTNARRTLPLTASLIEGGIDAWTPTEVRTRRASRSKAKVEQEAPITPTFVFVRAAYVPELVRCLHMPINPHPAFSLFRYFGAIPVLADSEIAALREAEEGAKYRHRKAQRFVFPIGEKVRVPEGPFAGMSGIVEEGTGKFALVFFGGAFRVQIATFLLQQDAVDDAHPVMGAAA